MIKKHNPEEWMRYQAYLAFQEEKILQGKKPVWRSFEGWQRYMQGIARRKAQKLKDPDFREKENAKARERYRNNREYYNAVSKRWQKENRDEWLEKRRQWRKDNPAMAREYDRRNYASSFKSWLARFRRGEITLPEITERMRRSLARFDGQLVDGAARGHKTSVRNSKTDSGTDESEA